MKLSIITINYNNLKGLEVTINSVLNQTFPDFEYLVIDGGSTDGGKELIEQNQARFAYAVSERDSGIFNAMNKGIRHSKGEYLLFLNSGDFLVSDQVLTEVFRETRSADVVCGKCRISDNGKIVGEFIPPSQHTFKSYYMSTISHQATFIRRALFEKYGLYDESLRIKGDWEFWIRTIIKNNSTVENVDIVISDYNMEGFSSLPQNEEASRREMEEVLSFVPQRIKTDYDNWTVYEKDISLYYWLSKKQSLKRWLYLYRRLIG